MFFHYSWQNHSQIMLWIPLKKGVKQEQMLGFGHRDIFGRNIVADTCNE